MSDKTRLRETRAGTVINTTSKRQDKAILRAVRTVKATIETRFPTLTLHWAKREMLTPLIEALRHRFPEVSFCHCHDTSFMTPDGGILSLVGKDRKRYPILIAEKKNQGTNDLRVREGKPRQAQGNAIERLGKNVIGFRVRMLHEAIFPFVCFGDGCDFADDLSILDRVRTIAMFGELNQEPSSAKATTLTAAPSTFAYPNGHKPRWKNVASPSPSGVSITILPNMARHSLSKERPCATRRRTFWRRRGRRSWMRSPGRGN